MTNDNDIKSWDLSNLLTNFENFVKHPSSKLNDKLVIFSQSTIEKLTSINQIDTDDLSRNITSQAEGFSKSLIENLQALNTEGIAEDLKTKMNDAANEVGKFTDSAKDLTTKTGEELFKGATSGTNNTFSMLKSIVSPAKIDAESELKEYKTISKAPSTSSSETLSKTDSITEKTSISETDKLSTHSNSDSEKSKTSSIFSRARTLFGLSKKSSIRSDSSSDNSGPLSRAPSITESVESSSSKSSLSSAIGKLKSGFGKLKSRSSSITSSRSSSSSFSRSSSSSSSSSFSRSSSSSSKTGDSEDAEKKPSIFSRSYKRFSDFKNGKDNTVLWFRNTDRGGNVKFEAQVPLRCPSLNLSGKLGSLRKKMQQKTSNFYRTSGETCTNLSGILSSSRSNSYSSNTSGSSWNISSSLSRARTGIESFGNYISESSGSLNMRESISENWRAIKECMPDKSYSSGSGSYRPSIDIRDLSMKGSNALRSASIGISSMRDRIRSSNWSAGIGYGR